MILQSVSLLFFFIINIISGAKLGYMYNELAGGWLKLHVTPATWDDASIICDIEGAVVVTPVTVEIRDAVKGFVPQKDANVLNIYTNFSQLFSLAGVSSKVAVVFNNDFKTCFAWSVAEDKVINVKCDDKLPFVCYKKRACGADPGYTFEQKTDSCYKFHRNGLPWSDAYKKCKQEGGYLAIINSLTEHKVIKELIKNNQSPSYALVGFRDFQDGESWKTVKGQSLAEVGFERWATGEPNNGFQGTEHCGSVTNDGNLNDLQCEAHIPFFCEKNAY